jgi:hypothetical protein
VACVKPPLKIMENLTTSKTREVLLQDVGKLKRDAVRVAQDVQDHATAHVDETKQKVTDTILTVRDTLTTHPISLLGVGFAVGLLVGFRFHR